MKFQIPTAWGLSFISKNQGSYKLHSTTFNFLW